MKLDCTRPTLYMQNSYEYIQCHQVAGTLRDGQLNNIIHEQNAGNMHVLCDQSGAGRVYHVCCVKKAAKHSERRNSEGEMAQTAISGFYPARRRAGEHGSVKRRKTGEGTRLDIPVLGEGADPASIPHTQPVEVIQDGARKTVNKALQKRHAASTTVKRRPRSKRTVKAPKQGGPSLLDLIGRGIRDTSPPPPLSSSPRKRQTTSEPPDTPTKIPALSPPPSHHTTLTLDRPPSHTSTPVKSERPLPPPSPRPVETRAAALVRLAREKMAAKSAPANTFTPPAASPKQARPSLEGRGSRMAARRRLLADPVPAAEGSRTQSKVVANLYKLSTKDLAQPTHFEGKSRVRKPPAPPTLTPRLHEFTALTVESPTKSKA